MRAVRDGGGHGSIEGRWALAASIALGASLGLAACSDPPRELAWVIELETLTLRARAQAVHTEIRQDGCGGGAVYQSDVRPTVPATVPPELPPGRWGFAAEALDADCVRFAGDCDDVELPGPTRVESVLRGFPGAPACPRDECTDGICGVTHADGGPPPPIDAGPDAGRDAGRVWADAGPRDGGPPLRPFLPCGGTWEEELDPYLDVSGSVSRLLVEHDDGLCAGCRDEVLRLASGTTITLRIAFAESFSPLAVREPDAGTARIDVCGARYGCDLNAAGTPGFQNIPIAACGATDAVTGTGECEVSITAEGGPISIRRLDVGCRSASGPPAVQVRLDGMPALTRPAPANVLLTWSADRAVSCTGTGTEWSGPQHTSGSVPLAGLLPGPHVATLTCMGPGGATASDTARIDVTP